MEHSASDPLDLVDTIVDNKYRIGALAGEGGFSVVYRAKHITWDQTVALKFFRLPAEAGDSDRQAMTDAFLQEGKLMIELSTASTAVVQARDVGTCALPSGERVPYMVLEWLEGSPLDHVLMAEALGSKSARCLAEVIECMDAPARALALAHRRGIVHRDIKPSNLFVVPSQDDVVPTVKILDFGIAKVMARGMDRAEALKHTTLSLSALSPTHAAPEQFRRTYGATGPWTDVYAFALVLVEILRGGLPALDGEDPLALGMSTCDANRRPTPRRLGVDVSDEVEAVFSRALAVSPAERHATLGDFWSALLAAAGMSDSRGSFVSLGSMAYAPTTPVSASQPNVELSVPAPIRVGGSSTGAMLVGSSVPFPPAPPTGNRRRRRLALYGGTGIAIAALLAAAVALRNPRNTDGADSASSFTPPNASSEAPTSAVPPACPPGMAYSPGGSFFMGSNETGYELWKPAHKVQLSPYCIDIHEVTASDYKTCSDIGECLRPASKLFWPKAETEGAEDHARALEAYAQLCTFGKPGLGKHPINCVTWKQADRYCRHRSARLPTEAEWEFAARGSDGRVYPWGDEVPDEKHMNACGTECTDWQRAHGVRLGPEMYDAADNYPGTAPVGSFPAGVTMIGLRDMVGNVFEWTADYMASYEDVDVVDPKGPSEGARRVIRGGAFNGGHVLWVNPAFRYSIDPNAHTHGIGFRCAANASSPRKEQP